MENYEQNLEKEIGLYTTRSLLKKRNHDTCVYHLTQKDCDNIAHHFAEWQREKDIKLEKIDDLEEFAQKWAYSNYHEEMDEVNCDCLYSGVKKGAEWQKQRMKEALQTEYEKGRFDMREEMKMEEHINNIISCLEEYLQPGFPIFKAGISKEITWLNSLIIKND